MLLLSTNFYFQQFNVQNVSQMAFLHRALRRNFYRRRISYRNRKRSLYFIFEILAVFSNFKIKAKDSREKVFHLPFEMLEKKIFIIFINTDRNQQDNVEIVYQYNIQNVVTTFFFAKKSYINSYYEFIYLFFRIRTLIFYSINQQNIFLLFYV